MTTNFTWLIRSISVPRGVIKFINPNGKTQIHKNIHLIRQFHCHILGQKICSKNKKVQTFKSEIFAISLLKCSLSNWMRSENIIRSSVSLWCNLLAMFDMFSTKKKKMMKRKKVSDITMLLKHSSIRLSFFDANIILEGVKIERKIICIFHSNPFHNPNQNSSLRCLEKWNCVGIRKSSRSNSCHYFDVEGTKHAVKSKY